MEHIGESVGKATLSQRVLNEVVKGEKKNHGESRNIGKDDRATSEQVMDPRTRMIIFKLLSSNFLRSVDGCVSTGKEANVYHATSGTGESYALKVFKTSILVFKDRDKYVAGEFRFRNSYNKRNPRKMVKMWALKELRNLKRLYQRRVSCPNAILLKNNVLIMEFIGREGWPAIRLKEVLSLSLSPEKIQSLYFQCVKLMLKMFKKANLAHGDLSEYNILYVRKVPKEKRVYFGKYNLIIIDVSQSVELDHPMSDEFLKMDIRNCDNFFKKLGITEDYRLFPTHIYSLIKDEALKLDKFSLPGSSYDIEVEEELIDSWIQDRLSKQLNSNLEEAELIVEDPDPNKDFDYRFIENEMEDNISEVSDVSDDVSQSDEDEPILTFDLSQVDSNVIKGTYKLKNMSKEERKEHKKKVKEAARERRKLKTPKAVKKRNKKVAQQKKKKR